MVVTPDFTGRVEGEIADLERRVPLPDAFVIPGGTPAAAALDVDRGLPRRAGRPRVRLHPGRPRRHPEMPPPTDPPSDLPVMFAPGQEANSSMPATRPLA